MTATSITDGRAQVRLNALTAAWLNDRAGRMHTGSGHLQIKVELELWRGVLHDALRRIRLTLDEASCLADVLNNPVLDSSFGRIVYAEAFDAFRLARETPLPGESSYAAKWSIDEGRLLDVLQRLDPVADHALRDAMSQWWDMNYGATVEGFASVGMNVTDDSTAREGPDDVQ